MLFCRSGIHKTEAHACSLNKHSLKVAVSKGLSSSEDFKVLHLTFVLNIK